MANGARVWSVQDNAREVLEQLHRILASCRGGNIVLASMLYLKMAQIPGRQQLLLEYTPRIEELGDQWIGQMIIPIDFDFGLEGLSRQGTLSASLSRSDKEENRDGVDVVGARTIAERELELGGQTGFPEAQAFPWAMGNSQELVSPFTRSNDLYEQLQNFDSSFIDFELADVMDPLLSADSDIPQRITDDEFCNALSPNSNAPQ